MQFIIILINNINFNKNYFYNKFYNNIFKENTNDSNDTNFIFYCKKEMLRGIPIIILIYYSQYKLFPI